MNPDELTFHHFNTQRDQLAAATDTAPSAPVAETAVESLAGPGNERLFDQQRDCPDVTPTAQTAGKS